jgi:hypothetical protein
MEFVTVHLGARGLAFAEHNRARIPFTMPAPVSRVYPMLQSFFFKNLEHDKNLLDLQIRLTPHFNSGDSATEGELEIETIFKDDPGGGFFSKTDIVELQIAVLVVGV